METSKTEMDERNFINGTDPIVSVTLLLVNGNEKNKKKRFFLLLYSKSNNNLER